MGLKYALRTLRRDRGFAAVAVLTLALGIGANTAIFSLIHGILLKPIPFREPDRLVTIDELIPKLSRQFGPLPVNARHFFEWQKLCKSFDGIAAIDSRRMNLTGAGEPEQIGVALISANTFELLGT
jgi:hypothetical protein